MPGYKRLKSRRDGNITLEAFDSGLLFFFSLSLSVEVSLLIPFHKNMSIADKKDDKKFWLHTRSKIFASSIHPKRAFLFPRASRIQLQ